MGFSPLQGPHQLAQKSTSTYLPLKLVSEIIFPLASGSAISGAIVPAAIAVALTLACTCVLNKLANCVSGSAFNFSAAAFAKANTCADSIDLKLNPNV